MRFGFCFGNIQIFYSKQQKHIKMKSSSLSDSIVIVGFCLLFGISRAMVIPSASSSSNGIFTIPNRMIDETDLLEEHGRFLLANMNQTFDPCENFYEYACGNWKNDTMVPLLGRNNTLFYAMQVKVNEVIVDFLKNTTIMDDRTAETKAKKHFGACMNMSEDLSQGYRTVWSSMKEPVLKEGEALDWMILNFYSEYGVTPLLPLSIQYNSRNIIFEIVIEEPSAYLTSSSFNFTKMTEDFKFENKDVVEKELEELKIFEKKLIASVPVSNISKAQSLEDFMDAHNSSDIDWKRFFDLAFNGTTKNSWKIHDNIMNFTSISKFLNKSDTGVMFRYAKWRNILKFYRLWSLETSEKTRESKCREMTVKYFNYAFIPWFIETTFDQERRTDALLISKRLKNTFYSFIDQATWLDGETKSGAKSKLRAMDLIIGYTDDMRHRSEMDKAFKEVIITKDYWENLMNLERNRARVYVKMIGKASINPIIGTHEVNAYYADFINLVFVAIGISQLPLYHIKLPNSLKFAGIGNLIGHEMAHGFDSGCYEYDYDGKKRNWWSPESLRNFKERYQCLESQYNKFIYNGMRTNGNRTSGDNIADNTGLRIAYHSYLRLLEEKGTTESGKDKPLPGVDFTNKQLFFLKFAQTWCDGRSPEDRMKRMATDDHAYDEFRVIGTLMNMPEFSEEFNCALGTDMNPLKKCVIW
ncbi:endothelin-converting enzyme 1 [Eupeodes corollae]|uniref:endothelin-converting enzyme 1 n=1 Tax=Eupeodes corollae TaxID=290404 RepID=UPI002492A947|nr:endothelin-converting enzyme 1 [Eupeodes corollae]